MGRPCISLIYFGKMPSSALKRPTCFLCVFSGCFHLSVIPFRYMPGLLLHPGTALSFLMFPPILNGPISTLGEIALLLFSPDPRGNSHNPKGKQPQYSSSQTFRKKQPVYHPKLLKATQTQGKSQDPQPLWASPMSTAPFNYFKSAVPKKRIVFIGLNGN